MAMYLLQVSLGQGVARRSVVALWEAELACEAVDFARQSMCWRTPVCGVVKRQWSARDDLSPEEGRLCAERTSRMGESAHGKGASAQTSYSRSRGTNGKTGETAVRRSRIDTHYPAHDPYTSMACVSISLCNAVNLLGTLSTKETTPVVARAQTQESDFFQNVVVS